MDDLTRHEKSLLNKVFTSIKGNSNEECRVEDVITTLAGLPTPEWQDNMLLDYEFPKQGEKVSQVHLSFGRSVNLTAKNGGMKLEVGNSGELSEQDFRMILLQVAAKKPLMFMLAPVACRPSGTTVSADSPRFFLGQDVLNPSHKIKNATDVIATALHKDSLEPVTDKDGNYVQWSIDAKTLGRQFTYALGSDVKPTAYGNYSRFGELFKNQAPVEAHLFSGGISGTSLGLGSEKRSVDINSPAYLCFHHGMKCVSIVEKSVFDSTFDEIERDRVVMTPVGLIRRSSVTLDTHENILLPQTAAKNNTDTISSKFLRIFANVRSAAGKDRKYLEQAICSSIIFIIKKHHTPDSFVYKAIERLLRLASAKKREKVPCIGDEEFISVFQEMKSSGGFFNPGILKKPNSSSNSTVHLKDWISVFILWIFFPILGFPRGIRKLYPWLSFYRYGHVSPLKGFVVDLTLYILLCTFYASVIAGIVLYKENDCSFHVMSSTISWSIIALALFATTTFLSKCWDQTWKVNFNQLELTNYIVSVPFCDVKTKEAMRPGRSHYTAYDYYHSMMSQKKLERKIPLIVRPLLYSVALFITQLSIQIENIDESACDAMGVVITAVTMNGILFGIMFALEWASWQIQEFDNNITALSMSFKGEGDIPVARIDLNSPENVVAWQKIYEQIMQRRSENADSITTLSFALGVVILVVLNVLTFIEGTEYIMSEYIWLGHSVVYIVYALRNVNYAQRTNKNIKEIAMRLKSTESDLVSHAPVMDPGSMTFDPQPPELKTIVLPAFVEDVIHRLAENAHDVWAHRKILDGWVYGEVNDVQKKEHTDLIPYEDLSCVTQSYDYLLVQEVVKALYGIGYRIQCPQGTAAREAKKMVMPVYKGKKLTLPGNYVPAPVDTLPEDMPPQCHELNEALAVHVHHKWARSRIDQGYQYGPKRCDTRESETGLRHPFLKRFEDLEHETKEANRNATAEVIKTLNSLGYRIQQMVQLPSTALLAAESRRLAAIRTIGSLNSGAWDSYVTVFGFPVSYGFWYVCSLLVYGLIVLIVVGIVVDKVDD